MLCKYNFCFLELFEIFFFTNIFHPRLVETTLAKPMDMEVQLKFVFKHEFIHL